MNTLNSGLRRLRPRSLFPLTLGLFAASSLIAQPRPSTPSASPDAPGDEVISMEEYRIQQDREPGYRATQTTSANRINMSVKEVPMNITIITDEFMRDLGAAGQREALQWSAGVDDRRVRGFNTVDFLSNGFQRSSDFSSANVDRIEILRGPSAVLDGVTSPGGIINVVTKKPIVDKTFLRTTTRYGHPTERFYVSGDANFQAGPKLDHGNLISGRLIGSYEYTRSGIRGPLQTLLVRYGEDEEAMFNPSILIRPTQATSITLEYEYWNHNYGVQDEQNTAFRILVPGGNYVNGEIPLAVALGIPPERSWTGPDLRNSQTVNNLFASLDHKFSTDLSFNVSYNLHRRANPFEAEPRDNRAFRDPVTNQVRIRREWRRNTSDAQNESVRANLFYRFEIGETKHRMVAGAQELRFRRTANFDMGTVFNTTSTNYADIFDPLEPLPDLRLNESQFFWRFLRTDRSRTQTRSYFVNHQGRFFNDKLITLVGLYQAEAEQKIGRANKNEKLLPQAGLVYFFKPENNVFFNWAQSLEPNLSALDGFNNPLTPTFGESFEGGVKLAFLDSRIFTTASVYEIKQQDRVIFDPTAPTIDNPTADPTRTRGANRQVGEVTSRGFDLEAMIYPLRGWSVIGSYAYNDTFISKNPINPIEVGRQVNATFYHKWTLWNRYQFTTGPLNGLFVGGGVQWRDEKLRQYRNNAAGVPEKAFQKPNTRVDALIGYAGKAYDIPFRVSLNAKNLTRGEALTSGNAFVFGFKPGSQEGYYFKPKPEYVLTAEFEF